MKKLVLLHLFVFFILSCNDGSKKKNNNYNKDKIHLQGCLQTYEIDPQRLHDTLNKIYEGGIKQGHWLYYELAVKKTAQGEVIKGSSYRTIVEDGYYINNKKEGYWKFYHKDGTLKDSVEYKNDIAITN